MLSPYASGVYIHTYVSGRPLMPVLQLFLVQVATIVTGPEKTGLIYIKYSTHM